MRLWLLLVSMVTLGALFPGRIAAQQQISDEQAHEIVLSGSFEGGWQEYMQENPDGAEYTLTNGMMSSVAFFADHKTKPTYWGVRIKRDFHAILKLSFQDSLGRPLTIDKKALPPIYLYNNPKLIEVTTGDWWTMLPRKYFNPRGKILVTAVHPEKFVRSAFGVRRLMSTVLPVTPRTKPATIPPTPALPIQVDASRP